MPYIYTKSKFETTNLVNGVFGGSSMQPWIYIGVGARVIRIQKKKYMKGYEHNIGIF